LSEFSTKIFSKEMQDEKLKSQLPRTARQLAMKEAQEKKAQEMTLQQESLPKRKRKSRRSPKSDRQHIDHHVRSGEITAADKRQRKAYDRIYFLDRGAELP
jgi:septum formation inhibitor MinC